jgi:kynurenine 3-monooxygenase
MNVCIAGAGPVGLLSALYAHSRLQPVRITLFERRQKSEMIGSHGRSINLALSERGLRALAGISGLKEEILRGAVVMRGRCIHDLNSAAELKIPYGRDVVSSNCLVLARDFLGLLLSLDLFS